MTFPELVFLIYVGAPTVWFLLALAFIGYIHRKRW